jgi:multidrug efflux pump subunit AcrA (membrane-fusion protein)
MSEFGTVRVLVNVPQGSAPSIHVGQGATVLAEEFPRRTFTGKVTRTTNAFDPGGRTLVTEVDVANPTGVLMPGMYTRVHLLEDRKQPPLLIPGEAIITTPNALQVAVLMPPTAQQLEVLQRKENELRTTAKGTASRRAGEFPPVNQARRIHLQTVTVGRDYGPVIEIRSGLEGWEYIVVNPTDDTQEGVLISPRTAPPLSPDALPQGASGRLPSGSSVPRRPAVPADHSKGGEK